MGRDADDMRFAGRGEHPVQGSEDHRGGSQGGYRQGPEGRNDPRSDRYDHERASQERYGQERYGQERYGQERYGQERYGQDHYGQYGLTRGVGSYRGDSLGYPSRASRDAGGWHGSQGRFGHDPEFDRSQRAWSAPYESPAFRDEEGRFASSYRDEDRGWGYGGNAYGFTRHASPAQQSRGHRDPDYQQWREDQLRMLDDDYDSWRKERYQKFSDDFSQWRTSRASGTSGQQSQGQHNPKGSGSNNASSGASGGSQGSAAKSKDAT